MRPLDLDELQVLVEDQESIIKFLEDKIETLKKEFESKIKLLEDNAFSDRAKRIELENKVETLEELWRNTERYILDLIKKTDAQADKDFETIEELTNKIIRLECK